MDQDQQPNNPQQNPLPGSTPNQPNSPEALKSKKTGLIIAIVVGVVIILGIAAGALMNAGKEDGKPIESNNANSNQNTADSKYQNYDVTDKPTGISFSISFYKGAAPTEKNGRTFLNAGQEGSQTSIYLVGGKEGKIDCASGPSTSMKLNGESTTVCYKANGTQYGGYVTVNGMTAQLNLAGQKPVSMEEAKTIMESATFK